MSVEQDFRERLNEVSFYLRSLSDIEKRQTNRRRLFYRANATLAASRAAAFIMIYNCVEYGTKEALLQVRKDAASNVTRFEELIEYWQMEVVRHRYGKKLSDGVNFDVFMKDLRASLPLRPLILRDARQLPFSGNINHMQLIRLADQMGETKWRPPKRTLGGADLELVRAKRNDLAHGLESFEDVGSVFSCSDIQEKLSRIRLFMCSYIRMLDRYRSRSSYRV